MEFDAKEEIKNKLDVVEVISNYIQLQKAGTNYKACCPFHNEKTPSFVVSPQRQIWHCFGCNLSGDIFTFVMKFESVDFITALKILADKAGVTLPKFDKTLTSKDKTSYDIMDISVKHFHQNLLSHKDALEYLNKRDLSIDTIKEFNIGFAKDDWRDLTDTLVQKGYKAKDIFDTGLSIQKNDTINNPSAFLNNSNFYDRFRSRIMFPIANSSGQTIGYTARIFEGNGCLKTIKNIDETGKYINSPQTSIYEKGKILYGFNITKKHISQQNEAIIVEGTMDFLSGYITGHKNIVASLGTALTIDQLNLLKRLTSNLILAYDNDEAGKAATERNIKLCLSLGFNIKILDTKDSKDLSDFIKDYPGQLSEEVKNALPVMDFYIKRASALFNINIIDGKKEFLNYFLKKLKWESDIIKISYYLNKLSGFLDININAIEDSFKATPKESLEEGFVHTAPKQPVTKDTHDIKTRHQILSEIILSMFVQFPVPLKNIIIENQQYFHSRYINIIEHINKEGIETLNQQTDLSLKNDIDQLYILGSNNTTKEKDEQGVLKDVHSYITILKEEFFKNKISQLQNDLKNAESTNNQDEVNDLLSQINQICEDISQINKQQ